MPPQIPRVGLLSLPPEVRHRIYKYTLVYPERVIPYEQKKWTKIITPSILRTCRQIYREACPILYSENVFTLAGPGEILKWLSQIGRVNIKRLKCIWIFVDAVFELTTLFGLPSDSPKWYNVLDRLARQATGLRYVHIYWDAEESCGHFGAGKDVRFVRELAKIQGLHEMSIEGFYAKHWPEYLTKTMGVPVRDPQSQQDLRRRYQRGTENLIP
jgi:hypothetical protein